MTIHRYVANSRVAKIENREKVHGQQDGWWIVTEGPSPIAMRVGDRPPYEVGAPVDIILEVRS